LETARLAIINPTLIKISPAINARVDFTKIHQTPLPVSLATNQSQTADYATIQIYRNMQYSAHFAVTISTRAKIALLVLVVEFPTAKNVSRIPFCRMLIAFFVMTIYTSS
jgi:hypothetical protein